MERYDASPGKILYFNLHLKTLITVPKIVDYLTSLCGCFKLSVNTHVHYIYEI